MFGVPNFFAPRLPPPVLWPSQHPGKASYYDTSPLIATLNRLVDFDLLNTGAMRFSVGAVEVDTGNFATSIPRTAPTRSGFGRSTSWPAAR